MENRTQTLAVAQKLAGLHDHLAPMNGTQSGGSISKAKEVLAPFVPLVVEAACRFASVPSNDGLHLSNKKKRRNENTKIIRCASEL